MNDIYKQKAEKYKYKYLKLRGEYIGGGAILPGCGKNAVIKTFADLENYNKKCSVENINTANEQTDLEYEQLKKNKLEEILHNAKIKDNEEIVKGNEFNRIQKENTKKIEKENTKKWNKNVK